MKIDLHIHTRTGSDGDLPVDEVLAEAKRRNIALMSVTDHDSIDGQARAIALAREYGLAYITGVELNVTFPSPDGRSVSLDFLGYQFDINNRALKDKLRVLRKHREERARQILARLNVEFERENIPGFTGADLERMQTGVDGTFGRPHIADYLVEKGIVRDRQEAFNKYLVRCDVPKYPLSLPEASGLIREAGGRLVLAHPNDPHGTSLVSLSPDLEAQAEIIRQSMLDYIDGIECWHSRHDEKATAFYINLARQHHLLITGGSDCHQKPIIMGTLDIPDWVAAQFK